MIKFNQKSPNSNNNLKSSKKREKIVEDFDVYGKDLQMLMESSYSKEIPDLIFMFGYFIKNYGLLVQGIFRVSGNKSRMEEIKSNYILKKLLEINIDDIHNVTGLYKSFLREVPGGLIPYLQAVDLTKATKIYKKTENLDLITTELLKLPIPNYNLLKFTCSLLSHVCKCCGSNLMNSENLGTVFGPTFFSSIEDYTFLSIANATTTVLIHNFNELFKGSAPVHTNLNQVNNKNGSLSTMSSNTINSKCSNGQIITIKFGESYLSINVSNDMDNSCLMNSFQEEESIPFSDKQDSAIINNSFIGSQQFSNSLSLALKMCVSNHLFDAYDENDFSNGNLLPGPNLISNCMLNGSYQQEYHYMSDQPGYPMHYNSANRNVRPYGDKKKAMYDNSKYSLPRRISHPNSQQLYVNYTDLNQRVSEFNKSDNNSLISKGSTNIDLVNDRQLNQVPQLDLSTLVEPSESEESRNNFRATTGESINANKQQRNHNSRQTIHEGRILETDSSINQIQRRISSLKNQLREFENTYASNNGIKPDKSVKLHNEWYQKTLSDLKLLRQEKELLSDAYDNPKDNESDSVKSVKKKMITGSGDNSEHKFVAVTPIENKSVNTRPVSVLSESAGKVGINNESARSNTINSIAGSSSAIEDLSPAECENLKITLDQISTHLREERYRDNRPEDLDQMTPEQIECEKVTMQKALLNFESKYGRRKNPNAIQLMRPLYDRYRQVKKRLSQINEENRVKPNLYQSAWSTSKPLSSGLHRDNFLSTHQTNTIDIVMPSNLQFDNSELCEDSVSVGPNKSDLHSRTPNHTSHKRSVNTFQYRKPSIPNDFNNNNNLFNSTKLHSDDLKSELDKLIRDKKELQRILKDFENTFERETQRKLEKSDRLPMEREYARYKMIKNRIKELEESFNNSLS